MTAQRLLIDTGNLGVFHQSIGSLTLLDDSAEKLVVA